MNCTLVIRVQYKLFHVRVLCVGGVGVYMATWGLIHPGRALSLVGGQGR